MKVEPMLAAPMKAGAVFDWSEWAIEEKYDGHRMIIHVERQPPFAHHVSAFARPRGDGRMLERELAPALAAELAKFPPGVYDGELLAGETGTDVSRLDLRDQTAVVIFDIVRSNIPNTQMSSSFELLSYTERREALELIFSRRKFDPSKVRLAVSQRLKSERDVTRFVKAVWDSGGEGAILKKLDSKYYPGKRAGKKGVPLVWIKIKRVTSAALTVIGFEKTKGTVMNRGLFAKVLLRDDEGNETSAKTLNDYELEQFKKRDTLDYATTMRHRDIGRKLRIEFARRTRDGGYQGPVRWDRWEDE